MNSELVRVASPRLEAELAPKVAALTLAKNLLSAAVKKPTKALGQMLIERGVLSEDQLRIALMEQKSLAMPLGKVLVTLAF